VVYKCIYVCNVHIYLNVIYIHNEEFFRHRMNEIMLLASKWMELVNMLTKVNQTQRVIAACFPSYMEARPIK
jgi:hypothetical protein